MLKQYHSDTTQELELIQGERPFWGRGQPRCWHAFMTFGNGRKVANPQSEPCIWSTTSPFTNARKRNGRKDQRAENLSKRTKMRLEADAE